MLKQEMINLGSSSSPREVLCLVTSEKKNRGNTVQHVRPLPSIRRKEYNQTVRQNVAASLKDLWK